MRFYVKAMQARRASGRQVSSNDMHLKEEIEMAQIYGGRWEIISPLEEGGQAHTYLVRDKRGADEARYVLKRLKNIKRIEQFSNQNH